MPAERITMYSPTNGATAPTTVEAFEKVWEPIGWRRSPSETEPAVADRPSPKALKRTWVAYAVEHGGMTETEAKALKRDELAERFAGDADQTSSSSGEDNPQADSSADSEEE